MLCCVWFLVFFKECFPYYIVMLFYCTCIVSGGQLALMVLINVCNVCIYAVNVHTDLAIPYSVMDCQSDK